MSRQKDVENVVITRLVTEGRRAPLFQKRLLIPFRNGLLDPMTMTLHEHDPDFVTTRLFQVDWDETATCPFYDQWTDSQILPGALEDLEEVVSQMFDLTRAPLKGGLLFGPSRSGKGTFSRLVEHVAGKENTSAVSLHDMAKDKFAAADMFGKALNIHSDLSADEVSDLSLLKMALGEDLIRAQRKFGQPFDFTNTALMLFAANEVPAGVGVVPGVLRPDQAVRVPGDIHRQGGPHSAGQVAGGVAGDRGEVGERPGTPDSPGPVPRHTRRHRPDVSHEVRPGGRVRRGVLRARPGRSDAGVGSVREVQVMGDRQPAGGIGAQQVLRPTDKRQRGTGRPPAAALLRTTRAPER
ncbi:MAG: DUF5906 domain-containing protein [Candidatus Nanopelagicales bacterium]